MHVLLGSLYLTAALMMYKRTHNAGAALKSSILYWWVALYCMWQVDWFG